LKAPGLKNGIQDKAVKNKPLTQRQLQRNRLVTKVHYVVERIFSSKVLRYRGLAKTHAWHMLYAASHGI
jgi:IS5 family transposase